VEEQMGEITITLQEAGWLLVALMLAILLIAGIILMANLIKTVKNANIILEDVQVVSKIAADRTKDVDKIITDVSETVVGISSSLKENKGTFAGIISLIKAIASLKNASKKDEK
jgi:hypothetical protein